MNQTPSAIFLGLFASLCLAAGDSETRLQFKGNGFSIAPLEGTSNEAPHQAIMMFLPLSEGFSPNVNVQIQPYGGTLKEYAELSKQKFKAATLTVVAEKNTHDSLSWEYSGVLQDRKLHFYAKAELGHGKVYLVTATATESQWKNVGAKLMACVDSFKRDRGETAAPADADKPRR